MNRKIEFRGKCSPQSKYKGEWVTGSLVVPEQIEDNEVLIVVAHSDSCKSTYHVDRDTIGQFTGLYDKNGREIYEGDIVKFPHVGECTRSIIVWNEKVGAWCIKLKGENSLGSTPVGEMLSSYKIEVIGNIHDNPELIKEEQQ